MRPHAFFMSRVDLAAAAALEAEQLRHCANQTNAFSLIDWQDFAFVFQKHCGIFRNFLSQFMISFEKLLHAQTVDCILTCSVLQLRTLPQCKCRNTFCGAIDQFFRKYTVKNRLFGLLLTVCAAARHDEITACPKRIYTVIKGPPVTDNHPLIPPFLTKDRIQQKFIVTAVRPIQLVVGAHDRRRICRFHGIFKCGKVDFTKCALIYPAVREHPVIFL